jgi:nucleoside-diphosphate-sugar epimerase
VSTLIVGCGYLGLRVGRRLAQTGQAVFGTTRSASKADELKAAGVEPITLDVLNPESWPELPPVARVLSCVGHDRSSGRSLRDVYVNGLRNLLDRLPRSVSRFVYVSSTSVYGQSSGEWIDEESATVPTQEAGKACLEAESLVLDWASGEPQRRGVILRCAGLYGPGRVIRQAALERGEPIPANPAHYLNLIQIDDAATIALALLDQADPEPLYLACDDRPVERAEYYALAARLLNAPPPQFVSEPSSGRGDANRRISNRKIRENLGIALRYLEITTGLPAALRPSENQAGSM